MKLEHRLSRQPTLRPWPQPSHRGKVLEMKQTNKQDNYPEDMQRTLQGERETKPVHRDPENHKDTAMKTGAIVMGRIRNRLTDRVMSSTITALKKE